MCNDAIAEESGFPAAGAIKKLIGDQEFRGREIFAQRANCTNRNNFLDAEQLHRANVGAIVDFGGREKMASAVTSKKGHAMAFQRAYDECIGGITKGSLDTNF